MKCDCKKFVVIEIGTLITKISMPRQKEIRFIGDDQIEDCSPISLNDPPSRTTQKAYN